MSRGPTSCISVEEILKVLPKFNILHNDGKLRKATDPVWTEFCEALDGKIKVVNLYSKFQKKKIKIPLESTNENPDSRCKELKIAEMIQTSIEERADSITVFLDLYNDVFMRPILKEIACEPSFYCIYRWPDQLYIWKKMCKVNQTMVFYESKLEPCLSLLNIDRDCHEVTAFSLQTFVENEVIPLFQIVGKKSCATNIAFLKIFFLEWLREKLLPPNQLLVSPNFIVIKAAISCFNHATLFEYLRNCFHCFARENLYNSIPVCLIKIDFNVLMISFYKKNESNDERRDFTLKFYVCCFLYIATLSNTEQFLNAVIDAFILLTSPFKDQLTIGARDRFNNKIPTDMFKKTEKMVGKNPISI